MANNHKENPRYNVVSLRITDAEKAALDEVSQRTSKSLSKLLREAVMQYTREVMPVSMSS
jgi:predicted DNA-binding protein